jgi:predicted acetyltransferase
MNDGDAGAPAKVEVLRARRADKTSLDNLLQLYMYDFSEMLGTDVTDEGRFDFEWLHKIDEYWKKKYWHAFLVKVDGKLAGFAFVRERGFFSGRADTTDMTEFFIMRKYRRHRVGSQAAARLFDMFPGKWEVRQEAQNLAAQLFWRNVIQEYTGGRYEERLVDNDLWNGPVQSFDGSGLSVRPAKSEA